MKKLKQINLVTFILFPTIIYANTTYKQLPLSNLENNPTHLKSLSTLQSLKNINSKVEYRAPFIHDLKNHHDVHTLFVESNDLPIIDIQLTFNAGSARDEEITQGAFGLANMTAQLMLEGTEQHSAQKIASIFENIGAQLSIKAYRDMFIVRLRTLSDQNKFDPALNMMLDIISNASFKMQSFNSTLSNLQVGKKQINENPNHLLSTQFNRLLYGNHPYAEPISGTHGSLKKIDSILLKKFRDQFIVAQNMNIAITGNLSSKEATKISNKISSNLKQGRKAKPLPQPLIKNGFNIKHIPFNSTQAYVSIGHISTTRDDPNRLALEVANQILGGGGFNSLLTKELRVKRGYTYGVTSNFKFSQSPGFFNLGYSTQQEQLLNSIQVAHKILVDFTQKPVNPHILEEVKIGLLRAFPMNYSSNASINAQLGSIGFYNESIDFLNQYSKNLMKLTASDLQNAIKKYIHPDQLTLVIVSKELDQEKLVQILQNNLLPTTKLKLPTIDEIPIINAPPPILQEAVSPSSAPSVTPASI